MNDQPEQKLLTILFAGFGFEEEPLDEAMTNQLISETQSGQITTNLDEIIKDDSEFQGIFLDSGRLIIWLGNQEDPRQDSVTVVPSDALTQRAEDLGLLASTKAYNCDGQRGLVYTVVKGTFCAFLGSSKDFQLDQLHFQLGRTGDGLTYIDYDQGLTYAGEPMELTWDEEAWSSKQRYLVLTDNTQMIHRSDLCVP